MGERDESEPKIEKALVTFLSVHNAPRSEDKEADLHQGIVSIDPEVGGYTALHLSCIKANVFILKVLTHFGAPAWQRTLVTGTNTYS